jgi:hypothetical protein
MDGHRSVMKGNSRWHLLEEICSRRAILLFAGLTLAPSAVGQTEVPIKGTVVTKDAQPVAGVTVYGSVGKTCCPSQREEATTNEKGEFLMEHPAAVVHLWKANLQPLALVVTPGTSQFRIVMTAAENNLTVPACSRTRFNHRQIGWGREGMHFTVPKDGARVSGGKPDVDYVEYVIKPNKGEAYLELWFGRNAFSAEPDDEQFVESVSFSQRNLLTSNGETMGEDSWGQLKSGLSWRHTGGLGSGARYRDANKDEAHLFDQIIDSICMVPHPTK